MQPVNRASLDDERIPAAPAAGQQPQTASPDPAGSVTCLVGELIRGDSLAAQTLWQRFFPRLCGLARKTLAGQPQRVADADDAAQSAFISFWQQACRGDLAETLDRDSLWNLLGVMTVRKALKQVRHERAEKRGGGRVLGEAAIAGTADETSGRNSLENLIGRMAPGDFDLHCEELLLMLDEELRTIAMLRLLGHTNRDIARQLGCTERKVERKLNLVRLRWKDEFAEHPESLSE